MKTIFTFAIIAITAFTTYASELYVRVNTQGLFYASVNNQTQYNTSNIFRFFDLPSGTVPLQINRQTTNLMFCSNFVSIGQDQRIIAEVDANGYLRIIETIQLVYTNWYTSTPVNSNGTYNPNPPNAGGNYGNNLGFEQFLSFLDTQSFDSNKLTESKKYVSKTQLSAAQLVEISKKFGFDSNRLEFAKAAYANCYDKANYFLFKSTFTFSSNYSALEEYIEGQ